MRRGDELARAIDAAQKDVRDAEALLVTLPTTSRDGRLTAEAVARLQTVVKRLRRESADARRGRGHY